ncbi:MAG: SagB/ThcOx family dehydrogenase [Methanomicrobiales archaeon]|nr:SagB/ThcOx family dehydrogenase [Methanomicrobiales archaeon]
MNRKFLCSGLAITLIFALVAGCAGVHPLPGGNSNPTPPEDAIRLPEPRFESDVPVEAALRDRRSVRVYADVPLTLADIGQVLWAAQGVTDERGYRTTPSAGALYPLEIYVVAGDLMDLPTGIYHYQPDGHILVRTTGGDQREALQAAAVNQTPIGDAPATIVICAIPERTTAKYGERGMRYVYMEAGHASENVYIQAVAMDLATIVIGAFDDARIGDILDLPGNTTPLYIMPVGKQVPGGG